MLTILLLLFDDYSSIPEACWQGFIYFKVTFHIGADQNFEIEIFAEYKYTLNELLVKINVFCMSNSLRDMTNESFTGSRIV